MILDRLFNTVLGRLIEHRTRKSLTRAGKPYAQQERPSFSADLATWASYWKMVGQPWRTEPEISRKRQQYLAERLAILPDVPQGIYPMKNIKLSRADIEWLLATHDNGRGPIDPDDKKQRERKGLDLRGADLCYSDLRGLPLTQMRGGLNFEERTRFPAQKVQEMAGVQLAGARLSLAHLERADLYKAHLQGSTLREAHLGGAVLYEAFFSAASNLKMVKLGDEKTGIVLLADVRWGDVNLAVVNWSQIKMPGDELVARQSKTSKGEKKEKAQRLAEYHIAIRANRQLAAMLRAQGIHEEADRFAYQAQKLTRRVFWWERKVLSFFFAWFLYLLAGYGYRPGRSVIAYLLVIGIFAALYFGLSTTLTGSQHLAWYEALVISLTAFHGRGFFADQFRPGEPQAFVAAVEAVIGLLIEISFIATFTQRFFGK